MSFSDSRPAATSVKRNASAGIGHVAFAGFAKFTEELLASTGCG
jgi:hypothetical protein